MKNILSFVLVMVCFILMNGCLEYDAADMRCDCRVFRHALRSNDLTGEWDMTTESQDEICQGYMRALLGQWDGLGMTESNRLVLHENGEYQFYMKSGDSWLLNWSGVYWVEMIQYRGVPYPELHMSWPDNDDYPIRFHFEGNVLHLEEATDGGEPEMRYLHVPSESSESGNSGEKSDD